jgi:hypothetical protein
MADIRIMRRRLIRLALVVVWIGLGVLLFVLNRGHTLLVDNRNVESPALRAPDMITVTVDRGKPLELFRGDRDLFEVGGGEHLLQVEFSDGTPTFEARFRLPLKPDMFLVSIPKMINGIEPAIEVFHTQPEPRTDDAEVEAVGAEL